MKNQNKIIIAAAIGGAGFLVYKNWDKITKLFKKKDDVKPEPTGGGSGTGSGGGTGGGKTYTAYQQKVMKLQGNIGASIDGDAGSQTNRLTKEFFPNTFARLGNVSPANIDAYLALGTKKEIIDTTSDDIKARATAIMNGWVGGKQAVVFRTGNARAIRYDSVSKTYPYTGMTFVVKQGTVLTKGLSSKLSNGLIATDVEVFGTDTGNSYGVRKVAIDPREINLV